MHLFLAQLETDLFRTVTSTSYQVELTILQTSVSDEPLSTAASWRHVREYIDTVHFKCVETDVVLRPLLLVAQRAGMTEMWQNILVYLASSSLRMLVETRRSLGFDDRALWADITWAFLNAVRRIDLDSRRELFGRKIINDTDHDVRAAYRAEREIDAPLVRQNNRSDRAQTNEHLGVCDDDTQAVAKNSALDALPQESNTRHRTVRCVPLDGDDDDDGYRPGPLDFLVSNRIEEAEGVFRAEREWAIRRLRQLHRTGVLSRPHFLILLGCCLHGHSLSEMALRLGVNYATAKKQRQRAIGRLEKSAPDLSPNLPDSPLYLTDRSCRPEECRE